MKIQIGNDFAMRLRVLSAGAPEPLSEAESIVITIAANDNPCKRYIVSDYCVEDDMISIAKVPSSAVDIPGDYRVTVSYFVGDAARFAELTPAFTVVRTAAEADLEGVDSVSADLEIGFPNFRAKYDELLDENSENAVQNKTLAMLFSSHNEQLSKLMNQVFPLDVSLTLSKTIKEKGVSEDVKVSWTVKREGVTISPTSMQLYDGKNTIDVTTESSTTVNVSDTTIFLLTVEADGQTVTKSATISAYNLTYYGIGNSVNDIVPSGTSKLTASAKGNYTVTSIVGKSFILAVPSGVTAPSSFTMGGAPATLTKSNATVNGVIYTVFTSAVATVAATGTYIAN